MASAPLNTVVRYLRILAARETVKDLTDRELLERFSAHQDQAAFGMLMKRHGQLVWRVCRQMLGQHQDAEDAFQATFLVLARSAGTILKGQAIGSWLYGVAYRVSMKARRDAAIRRAHERREHRMAHDKPSTAIDLQEVLALLDEEVRRLPERQRAAFVLCSLEGRSHAEAARELGCKEGALAVTLTRARKLLRDRLARRGVTLSALLSALALSQQAASAIAPAALFQTTIEAATLIAAGHTAATGLLSAHAAALTEGIIKTMMLTKAKLAVLLCCAITVLGTGVGLVASQDQGETRAAAQAVASAPQGKPTPANAQTLNLRPALDDANAVEDPGQKARALLVIAQAQTQAGEKKAAAETLQQAVKAAEAMPADTKASINQRWSVLGAIAGAQATVDTQETARKTFDLIKLPDPPIAEIQDAFITVQKSFANQLIALGLARGGKFKEAVETVALIDAKSGYMKGNALVEIVSLQSKAGDAKGAKEAAKAIRGDTSRAAGLAAIAQHQPKEGAEKTIEEAMQLVGNVLNDRQGQEDKAFMLRHVAMAQMARGDVKAALETAESIPDITEKDVSGEVISFPFRERTLVEVKARLRDFKGAKETAQTIDDNYQKGYQKGYAWSVIAKGLAEVKEAKQALEIADGIAYEYFKAITHVDIARAQAQAGDSAGAAKTFELALRHAEAVPDNKDGFGRCEVFRLLAAAQAEVDQAKAAEMWIGQQQSRFLRTWAFVGLSEGTAKRQAAKKTP